MRIFHILILTLIPLPSLAIDDSQLDKHLSTYKKWSTSLYAFDIARQHKYLSPELSKNLSRIKIKPATKETLTCKSYLVSHFENEAEEARADSMLTDSFNVFGTSNNDITLNVFNECMGKDSTIPTHLSGISINISNATGKITQYQIKSHKNKKAGFSDIEIDKEFNLFAKLTEKKPRIDLKNHDFADDIQRLKEQNQ